MTRILLVDDQTLILELLQTRLESETDLEVVGVANNGQMAIQQVEVLQPDVVLLDLQMPVMNGLVATKIISHRFPQTKIIVLSGSENPAYLAEALKKGAHGYLIKTISAIEIAKTIRFINQGSNQIEPSLLKKLLSKQSVAKKNHLQQSNSSDKLLVQPPSTKKVKKDLVQKLEPFPVTAIEPKQKNRLHRRGVKVLPLYRKISPLDSDPPAFKPISNQKGQSNSAITPTTSALKDQNLGKAARKSRLVSSPLTWVVALILIVGSLLLLNRRSNTESLASSSDAAEGNTEQLNLANSKLSVQSALPVETVQATAVDSYQQSSFYTGNVVPQRTIEQGFEYSGQITQIAVKEGDRVGINTPLAYLDTREAIASQAELLAERSQLTAKLEELKAGPRPETIASAKATVRDLQQQLELAQTKSQRRKNLFAQGAISREQLDENLSNTIAIQARLDKVQSELNELLAGTRTELIAAQNSAIAKIDARLDQLKIKQEKQVLKAPFTATVSQRLVDEGTIVAANQPVLRLVENKPLEARIGIPVKSATQITLGSYHNLNIGGEIYEAQVTALLPEVDSNTRTITAVLTLKQSVANVFPGQVAKLNLITNIATAGYWLPTTALVEGARGLWFCYALGKKAQGTENVFAIERREVEVLHTQSDRVLVRGTVQPGDRIISNGTHRIVDGQLVRQ